MSRAGIHLPTLAAVGALAAVATNALHESAGHLVTGLLVGATPRFWSSTGVQMSWSGVPLWGYRLAAAGGTGVDLVVGIAALLAAPRCSRGEFPSWPHCFLWLLGSFSTFTAGTYLIVSPLFGFGDWTAFLRGLHPFLVWQVGIPLAGGAVLTLGFQACRHGITPLLGADPTLRRDRARLLTALPWGAAGVVASLAALLSPLGPRWALFAALGSTCGSCFWMLGVPDRLPDPAPGDAGQAPRLPAHPGWIAAGSLAALAFVAILGPGVVLSR